MCERYAYSIMDIEESIGHALPRRDVGPELLQEIQRAPASRSRGRKERGGARKPWPWPAAEIAPPRQFPTPPTRSGRATSPTGTIALPLIRLPTRLPTRVRHRQNYRLNRRLIHQLNRRRARRPNQPRRLRNPKRPAVQPVGRFRLMFRRLRRQLFRGLFRLPLHRRLRRRLFRQALRRRLRTTIPRLHDSGSAGVTERFPPWVSQQGNVLEIGNRESVPGSRTPPPNLKLQLKPHLKPFFRADFNFGGIFVVDGAFKILAHHFNLDLGGRPRTPCITEVNGIEGVDAGDRLAVPGFVTTQRNTNIRVRVDAVIQTGQDAERTPESRLDPTVRPPRRCQTVSG